MKIVFADTLYWLAALNPRDSWHESAGLAKKRLGRVNLVTTDAVFIELLAALARSVQLRTLASETIRTLLIASDVLVIPQTRELLMNGLVLYESRPDKFYSLTDCISMYLMKSMGIKDILTNDFHFAQEGFNLLIHPH
jgi:predicted nucleic acid-binding protein